MVIIHDVALIETNEVGAIMTDIGPYNTEMAIIEGALIEEDMFPHNHLYFLSRNKFLEGEYVCEGRIDDCDDCHGPLEGFCGISSDEGGCYITGCPAPDFPGCPYQGMPPREK